MIYRNVVANISKAAKADADKGAAVRQQQVKTPHSHNYASDILMFLIENI